MNAWTQLFLLPITAFIYSLDLMIRTLQAFQQTAQQIGPATPNTGPLPLPGGGLDRSTPIGGVPRGDASTTRKEVREMSDCCCSDQCGEKFCEVRMYEWYVLSVEPCNEKVVNGPNTTLVTTNMSGEAFSTYAMALYCSGRRISNREAQYLRICYRIQCTLPKERRDCCETGGYSRDQAQALSEIRDILRERWGGGTTTGTTGTTGTTTGTTGAAEETGTAGTTSTTERTGGGGRRGGGATASA